MDLRQTKRKNRDGTVAHYLQLAHNVRDPDTGVVKAKILHSFGRAEHLEREALERLIGSIARYLDQDPPLLASKAAGSGEVEAVDARNLGARGCWTSCGDGCYRAMDLLLETLDELQGQVFFTAADLLSLMLT